MHADMDTEHSGKHRHPLLKAGQKYRVVGGLTGEQGPQEVFGQSKAHPRQGQGAHMGFCRDACTCTISRLSEHTIEGESI